MRIRLTRGAYTGLVIDHAPHVAHELIKRGLAVEVVPAVPAPIVVEVATAVVPPEVEHAIKGRRRKGRA